MKHVSDHFTVGWVDRRCPLHLASKKRLSSSRVQVGKSDMQVLTEERAVYATLASSSETARTTAFASSAKSSYAAVYETAGKFPEYFLFAQKETS